MKAGGFAKALMVVGVLISGSLLIVPNFIRCNHRQGAVTACKSNLKNIGTALEMYSTDYRGHYPRNLGLLTPNYLKTLPVCPSAGYVTYRAEFGIRAPGNEKERFEDYYLVECTGANHVGHALDVDYPKYNGIEGLIERPRAK